MGMKPRLSSSFGFRPPIGARIPHRARPTTRRLVVLALVMLAIINFSSSHNFYREAFRAKHSPTTFQDGSFEEPAIRGHVTSRAPRIRDEPSSSSSSSFDRRDALLNRRKWRRLGGGMEGDVFAYNGTAIKVYDQHRSPFRNCLGGSAPGEDRWPTEIPATLLLGGRVGQDRLGSTAEGGNAFVPVTDLFFEPAGPGRAAQWHLVTPFFNDGTLNSLSKSLRSSRAYTTSELDAIYRPSLNRLLSALRVLHEHHNLCHDDIKPDNIFISTAPPAANSTAPHWLLGDLGNARHPSHPYHSSYLWGPLNSQLLDCRANDALRLLRSYATFLRRSVSDAGAFDNIFFDGTEAWSCLYWRARDALFDSNVGSAAAILTMSEDTPVSEAMEEDLAVYKCPSPGGRASPLGARGRYKGSLRRAVKSELRTSLGARWADFVALTALRGYPEVQCR